MAEKTEKQSASKWQIAKYFLIGVVMLLLTVFVFIIVYWAVWADLSPQWTGFGKYDEKTLGVRAKTLWDWMELLLIPIILAIAGFWFSHSQKQAELEIAERERETDREIALEKQQQQTLENYLDRMKELLLDRNLGTEATPEVKRLARTWTLNVLRELTAKRNRQVIQLLQELELIGNAKNDDNNEEILSLAQADLSGVDLSNAYLKGVSLQSTILRGADLSGADLRGANLNRAILYEAKLNKADLCDAKLHGTCLNRARLCGTQLSGANLCNANLREARLNDANLFEAYLNKANLNGADLSGADLSGADLSGADLVRVTYDVSTVWPKGYTLPK